MKKKLIILATVLLLSVTGCGNNKVINGVNNSNNKINNEEKKKSEAKDINIGETISNENYEISLKSLDFKDKIEYRTSEYSSYSITIDSGKKALTLNGNFKNLAGEKVKEYSALKCKVIIDGKYTYEGSFKAWQDLDPLVSAPFVLYAQVPESIVDTYKKIEFVFGFNKNFSSNYNDEVDNLDYVYKITSER